MAASQIAAVGGPNLVTIFVTLITSGAITGAIVTFVKLGSRLSGGTRSEIDVATLAQARGANEILTKTMEEVTRDRDYWRDRYEKCNTAYAKLVDEVRRYGL
jgi:hypothetical protein